MNIPVKLPINRVEDYHTHYLGQADDGRLFWGYQTFAFTKTYAEIEESDDWRKYRNEFAVVHFFDLDGNYLNSRHWSALSADTNDHELTNKLEEMLADLGSITFCNIEIKLFQTKIDNIIFGLIPDEQNEMIHLQPGSTISFQEPWDGEYYT